MNKQSYRVKKASSHYTEFIGRTIKSIRVDEIGASISIISTDGLELVIEPMSGSLGNEEGGASLNIYVNP